MVRMNALRILQFFALVVTVHLQFVISEEEQHISLSNEDSSDSWIQDDRDRESQGQALKQQPVISQNSSEINDQDYVKDIQLTQDSNNVSNDSDSDIIVEQIKQDDRSSSLESRSPPPDVKNSAAPSQVGKDDDDDDIFEDGRENDKSRQEDATTLASESKGQAKQSQSDKEEISVEEDYPGNDDSIENTVDEKDEDENDDPEEEESSDENDTHAEEDSSDDDDYYLTQWTQYGDGNITERLAQNDEDSENDFDEPRDEAALASLRIFLFYKMLIGAVFIVLAGISIYCCHHKGIRFIGSKAPNPKDDKKRLIEHEIV